MNTKPKPRGIRNNNPGNIRHGQKWQGLAAQQLDPDFCTFESPAWGIRAIARVLITYQDTHDLATIRQLIGRWAPPNENDTGAYVAVVAKACGVDPADHVSVHDYTVMRPLVEAIIRHENGQQPYTNEEIDEGLKRAGVVRKRNAATDPVNVTAAAAGTGATVATGAAVWHEVSQVSQDLRAQGKETGDSTLIIAGSAVSMGALLLLALVLYRKWRAKR